MYRFIPGYAYNVKRFLNVPDEHDNIFHDFREAEAFGDKVFGEDNYEIAFVTPGSPREEYVGRYLVDGTSIKIWLAGNGYFDDDGMYVVAALADGVPCNAFYNTAKRADYFSDSREDCIDWCRPYRIEEVGIFGGILYEVPAESVEQ